MALLNNSMLKGKHMIVTQCEVDPFARNTNLAKSSLFVADLHTSIKKEHLRTIFSYFGTVVRCELADENGKRKRFGFVQFDSLDAADSAIASLHKTFLAGKKLFLSKFVRKSERKDDCGELEFRTLYVKNFRKNVTKDLLWGWFSEYGNISSLAIMKDGAGKSKGFGFIEFKSDKDAKKAMEGLNGSKKLFVGRAPKNAARHALMYSNEVTSEPETNLLFPLAKDNYVFSSMFNTLLLVMHTEFEAQRIG